MTKQDLVVKTSVFAYALSVLMFVASLSLSTGKLIAQGTPAGTQDTNLNANDPDPVVLIKKADGTPITDLEFELTGSGQLKKEEVWVKNDAGADLQWSEPTMVGAGGKKWKMVQGGGSPLPTGEAGSLWLTAKDTDPDTGWSKIRVSRTVSNRTIYAMADLSPNGFVLTGNEFPAGTSAWMGFTNEAIDLAIVDLTLSIDNDQIFDGIGSELDGQGAIDPVLNTATYYFDEAIPPLDVGNLYWDYTGYSSSTDDAEVSIVAGTSGLMLMSSGSPRHIEAGARSFKIPTLRLKEASTGSMGLTVTLVSDGTYTFAPSGRIAAIVSSSALITPPVLGANGSALEIPVAKAGTTKAVLELSNLVLETTEAARNFKGPIYLYVKSKGTSRLRIPVGIRK